MPDNLPLHNLRDLAGPPPGRRLPLLRPGLILRSAAPPASPSPPQLASLSSLNISTVFDLRSGLEIQHFSSSSPSSSSSTPPDPSAAPQAWPNGPRRIHAPVFADADYEPEAVALRFRDYASADSVSGFAAAYLSILRAGGPAFRAILSHLASHPGHDGGSSSSSTNHHGGPVLLHCTAGKDRTGVVCALILSLCGVSDEDIAQEYALTEEGLQDLRPGMLARLRQMPAFRDDPEGAERMLGARPESMLATLKMLREEYGSAEEYVIKECGISPEAVARIRQTLMIDDASSAAAGSASAPRSAS